VKDAYFERPVDTDRQANSVEALAETYQATAAFKELLVKGSDRRVA
jgi:hypothetical protein